MPLTINYAKHEEKVITMGKEKADYYPSGATEPIVRPADVPEPNENPQGIVTESSSIKKVVETAKEKVYEDVAKTHTGKAAKKK